MPTNSSITSSEIFVGIFLANSGPLLCKIEMKYHSNMFRKFAYALFLVLRIKLLNLKNRRCYDGKGCSGVLPILIHNQFGTASAIKRCVLSIDKVIS